jgi:hypothetical protein
MTNPGSMGQQAAQQASASASRAAQQQASYAQQMNVQNASRAAHNHRYHYGPPARGGAVRKLFAVLFTLVFLAILVGVALVVLGATQPDWFDHLRAWFERIIAKA